MEETFVIYLDFVSILHVHISNKASVTIKIHNYYNMLALVTISH